MLSVGERCLDHGYGFHWPRGEPVPFLETPSGKRIQLEVEGKIPYLDVSEAIAEEGIWAPGCPGAAGSSNDSMRCDRVVWKATKFPEVPALSAEGGPPLPALRKRITLDLHSKEVIEELQITPDTTAESLVADLQRSPRDLLVYWYYDPKKASDMGWKASGVHNQSSGMGPRAPPEASVPPVKAKPDASQSASVDKGVPDADQVDSYDLEEDHRPGRSAAELKEEAKSIRHLLAHLPKNRFCKACQLAKAQPPPARLEKNKSSQRWKRPAAKVFGDEVTCDHWIAQNDVSRGIYGETVALTLRDRATNWLECQGMKEKSSDAVYKFLVNNIGQEERYK